MPLYEVECGKCGNKFEELSNIENRNDIKCPKCSGETSIVMSRHNSGFVWRDSMKWQPHLDANPVYCETKEDFKRELDKRGCDSPCLH